MESSPTGSASLRIIAAGIVVGFCYWASSVVMTLLLSVLLAYFLDPVVEWLERFRIPRAAGAVLVLIVALALLVGLGWMVWDRVDRFAQDWPKYSAVLKSAAAALEKRIQRIEARFSEIAPEQQRGPMAVRLAEDRPIFSLLLRGLGSLYSVLLAATFVPFLVFFMLAAKRDVWHATMQLFAPADRTRVKQTLEAVSRMLRSYIVGNALVAGILALVSWIFFWLIDLDYAFLIGAVSGLLNLVPYLGLVLAWVPPLVIGLTKYNSLWPFLGIAGLLAFFHLMAINVLVPALVGRQVHLNALAVTVALLFWGWLWGGIGFILAIPITATVKVVCDHVESWQPVGRWLGT
jgi:predicted PurR-regulated permease PerM